MNVFIAGLGVMGAAYAKGLSEAGHTVFGWDQSGAHIKEVRGYLHGQGLAHLKSCEVILIALPPDATGPFVKTHQKDLSHCALITDISSVKMRLTHDIESCLGPSNAYISHHPLTGYKTSGPKDHARVVFQEKPVIIIEKAFDETARALLNQLLNDLSFQTPRIMSAEAHDAWVAYTSHLPHVLSAALLHHEKADQARLDGGNSFQAMRQYAPVNVSLWATIFQENQAFIAREIDHLIETLNAFKAALPDDHALKAWMQKASLTPRRS